MTGAAHITRRHGRLAVVLSAGSTAATFLPDNGMLGTSMRVDDHELVALPSSVAHWDRGGITGIPLLHPWANRLGAWDYRVGRRTVDLEGLPLPVDENGLPIHGCLRSASFEITSLRTATDQASLETRYDASGDVAIMQAFPFPHTLSVGVTVRPGRLTVTTAVTATGTRSVPASFGWHPYLRVSGTPRREWVLRLPARSEIALDDGFLPTGERNAAPAQERPIGSRTFDDHYALGNDRRFAITTPRLRVDITFDGGYRYGQVYAPPRAGFVCVEPMVAPIDALRTGEAPLVQPGGTHRASFRIEVAGANSTPRRIRARA